VSRFYEMNVYITGFNPEQAAEIEEAIGEEWEWEPEEQNEVIHASGESDLCGGESAEEFAERVSKAAWEANGGFCKVAVRATSLEDLPCNTYELSEDYYKRITAKETA